MRFGLPRVLIVFAAFVIDPHAAIVPAVSATGHVVDAVTGRPIGGVIVALDRVPDPCSPFTSAWSFFVQGDTVGHHIGNVTTGPDGSFRIDGADSGLYAVSVEGRDWTARVWNDTLETDRAPLVDLRGQRTVDVTVPLWHQPRVSGRVVNQRGEPLVDVDVRFSEPASLAGHPALGNSLRAATDGDGRFLIQAWPGNWRLSVLNVPRPAPSGPGGEHRVYGRRFYPDAKAADGGTLLRLHPNDDVRNLDFSLLPEPAYQVRVHLSEPIGQPKLIRRGLEDKSFDSEVFLSSKAGDWTFANLLPGSYELSVVREPAMDRPGSDHGSGALRSIPTEPTRFVREDVLVEEHDLNLDVVVRTGAAVSGDVAFIGSAPLPSAEALAAAGVEIQSATKPNENWPGMFLSGRTFATIQVPPGSYSFGPIPLRGWTLTSATVHGQEAFQAPFAVEGTNIDDAHLVFTDTDPATIKGRVQLASGSPFRRVWVTILPADRHMWVDDGEESEGIRSLETGASGTYEAELRPGTYLVVASDRKLGALQTPDRLERFAAAAIPVVLTTGEQRALDLKVVWVQ